MRKKLPFYLFALLVSVSMLTFGQDVQDDFEGNGTINSWFGDDCLIDVNFSNPFQQGVNSSATVLRYHDVGGQFANVQFNVTPNFDLITKNAFSLKIYVPSSGITGTQPNQISLKLQNGALAQPWTTQSEIIKPIMLNTWQTVDFNFETDTYINLDPNSPAPINRTDFNRVVIQVNGEANNDQVIAYIDDLDYYYDDGTSEEDPIYDQLVWSDEFDGNGNVDSSKWHHQIIPIINGTDWANGEEQHYTDRPVNSYIEDGKLVIKAIKETYTFNSTKEYTSARLNSKYAFSHGRVEVRAKLPSVAGTWPAIWLLGKNISETGAYWQTQGFGTTPWPLCGEIDIMEPNIAKNQLLGTWHWDANDGLGYQINSNSINVPASETTNEFHLYSVIWSPTSMRIYYDDILVNQMNTVVPFNNEFFILLNLAMGGALGGTIDSNFTEDEFEIDYVRVYQESALSVSEFSPNTVTLYPNPAQDAFSLKFSNNIPQKLVYKLTDINGRVIDEGVKFSEGKTINFSSDQLVSGVYFLRLQVDQEAIQVLKFVKE